MPPFRLRLVGDRKALTLEPRIERELLYRIEESRGYEHVGDQWSPGFVRFDVDRGRAASIVASTQSWEEIEALSPVPGGKPFREVVPGGDITVFEDRWKWIETDMLPAYERLTPQRRRQPVDTPLGELAARRWPPG